MTVPATESHRQRKPLSHPAPPKLASERTNLNGRRINLDLSGPSPA
jgi:hypothetical protein